jgi:hypothetical protein
MTRAICLAVLSASLLLAPPTSAQGLVPAAAGQVIVTLNFGLPEACLDGRWDPNVADTARFMAEAEPALLAYLTRAASRSANVSPFENGGLDRRWTLDGARLNARTGRDPWAADVARLDLLGLRLGGKKQRGRALWRAFAADGTELGIYDGLFRRRRRDFELIAVDLFSPGAARQPPVLSGFCDMPGDVDAYHEARARHEERRAARRAERATGR